MKLTLTQYKKYEGMLRLSGLDILGSNSQVSDKLKDAGFSNIVVSGSGIHRKAQGVWSGTTSEVELPKQVVELKEL